MVLLLLRDIDALLKLVLPLLTFRGPPTADSLPGLVITKVLVLPPAAVPDGDELETPAEAGCGDGGDDEIVFWLSR